jgi:hypothetical protein
MRPTLLRTLATAAVLASPALGASLAPAAAEAQVGYPPARSPYNDIARGHTVTPFAGPLYGSGGKFGLGPHDGFGYGLRYDVRVSSLVALSFSGARMGLERNLIDRDAPPATRLRPPVDQSVTLAEAGLQFALTGQKSWRGFAPILGLGAGFAFAEDVAADTSGFEFGNKLFLHPRAGLRFFVTPNLHLRAEAGALFWKLDYPERFREEPEQQPGIPGDDEQSNAPIKRTEPLDDWTGTPWLRVGIGFTFRP